MATEEQKVQDSAEFFQSIGDKVKNLATNENGEAEVDEFKPVDEIESLCMNCHENVSLSFAVPSLNQGG